MIPRSPSSPRHGAAICLLLVALTGASTAQALEIEGVRFRDRLRVDGNELTLRSAALMRYKILFRGFVGALYLPPEIAKARVLEDVPKRLELRYFWSIRGAAISEAGEEILAKNVSPETLDSIRERVAELHRLYPDIAEGDRLALTYLPGKGTELRHNGQRVGEIPGADFAAAYFRIWLGAEPMDVPFRDALLAAN